MHRMFSRVVKSACAESKVFNHGNGCRSHKLILRRPKRKWCTRRKKVCQKVCTCRILKCRSSSVNWPPWLVLTSVKSIKGYLRSIRKLQKSINQSIIYHGPIGELWEFQIPGAGKMRNMKTVIPHLFLTEKASGDANLFGSFWKSFRLLHFRKHHPWEASCGLSSL